MDKSDPNILFFYHVHPDYIPPPPLSSNLIVCSPRIQTIQKEGRYLSINIPAGSFDVRKIAEKLPKNQKPEIVIVYAESSRAIQPRNLSFFNCPKILLIGDTHHLESPLQYMIQYARIESFDFHIILFDRHHASILEGAGIQNIFWIPGFGVTPNVLPFNDQRKPEVLFVGQVGKFHPRRSRLIQRIQDEGYPLRVLRCPHSETAQHYSTSLIAFNCSLNGDLNLRNFEILAAGGFLLTDRLCPESGINQILKEGRHYAAYGSGDELIEKISFFLRNPADSVRCAEAGQKKYLEDLSPERYVSSFWKIVNRDEFVNFHKLDKGNYDFSSDYLPTYEFLQDLHCRKEIVDILCFPGIDPKLLKELFSLNRCNIFFNNRKNFEDACLSEDQKKRAFLAEDNRLIESKAWDAIITSLESFRKWFKNNTSLRFEKSHRVIFSSADFDDISNYVEKVSKEGIASEKRGVPVFRLEDIRMKDHAFFGSEKPLDVSISQLKEKFNLSYHIAYSEIAQKKVGLTGKKVLEVGGSLPREFVIGKLNVSQWIAIENMDYWQELPGQIKDGTPPPKDSYKYLSEVEKSEELPEYCVLSGGIEDLPDSLKNQFDIVFSIAAFEHMNMFPLALSKMYDSLKPGGILFSMWSPIWSAHDGHHLPTVIDKSNRRMDFHNSPIPPWGHLLMRPSQLYMNLCRSTDTEAASQIVYFVYHSSHINRLFTEDYIDYIRNSHFQIIELNGTFPAKIDPSTQKRLESNFPGRKNFSNNGLMAILQKPS